MASSSDGLMRELADRLAIQDLVYGYNRAMDTGDEALFRRLFVPHAVCGHCEGLENIVQALRTTVEKYADRQHLSTNLVVELHGDQATGKSKSLMRRTLRGATELGSLTFLSYDDQYIRVAGQWQFLRRDIVVHAAPWG